MFNKNLLYNKILAKRTVQEKLAMVGRAATSNSVKEFFNYVLTQ